MKSKIIYTKVYPKLDIESLAEQLKDEVKDNYKSEENKSIFRRFIENAEKCVFVPLTQRNELKKVFIQQAIECSRDYELDLELVDTSISVEARFSFDYGPLYEHLKGVLILADETDFEKGLNGKDLSVILVFKTHKAVLKNNDE